MTKFYMCPVCGYPGLKRATWTVEHGSSEETCPSCGYEFGFTDALQGISYESWRDKWIAGGMKWRAAGVKPLPKGWNPGEQLRNLIDL